jgi:hypothetical protein
VWNFSRVEILIDLSLYIPFVGVIYPLLVGHQFQKWIIIEIWGVSVPLGVGKICSGVDV